MTLNNDATAAFHPTFHLPPATLRDFWPFTISYRDPHLLIPMPEARPRFVTLENFILDTFTRIEQDGTEVPLGRDDEIGGAGTYTLIGARMFLPPQRLGMLIDYTPETLPSKLKRKLDSYGDMIVFRHRTDGNPTLRAVNRYKGQLRIFEYLTPPLFLTPSSLFGTRLADPLPGVIHFVPMLDRLEVVLREIETMRSTGNGEVWDPLVIWEPDIPICQPENLGRIAQYTPRTHIISPNHVEALSLLSLTPTSLLPPAEYTRILAQACAQLANLRPRIGAILRCGHLGCCYIDTTTPPKTVFPPDGSAGSRSGERAEYGVDDVRWVGPYWDASGSDGDEAVKEVRGKVVDPTGAGNAFMGGLGAALDEGLSLHDAVLWGSVAASFVIEQAGLPILSGYDATSRGESTEEEKWNGERPMDRVEKLRARVARRT